MNPPTIVRLLGFPDQVRLTPRGTPEETSGVTIVADRDGDVEVTLRLAHSTLTFAGGSSEVRQIERVEGGTHHDVLLDWSLSGSTLAAYVLFEVDVRYADEHHANTATAIVAIEQRERSIGTAIAIGSALVAAAIGLAALARPRVQVREFTVDAPPEPPRPASTTRRPASTKRPSTKRTSSTASSAKASSARKTTGGGTRPGSGASGSAQRTGARGSSAARKSAPARSRRKSR